MTSEFKPEVFEDTYREKLLALVEARAKGKSIPSTRAKAPEATNVVNLMDVLQRSIEESKKGRGASSARKKNGAKKTRKRSAA